MLSNKAKINVIKIQSEQGAYFDKKTFDAIVSAVVQTVDSIGLAISSYVASSEDRPKWKRAKQDMQRVYIAEYTTHDDYGPLRETDVFSEEIDAWAFVLKQRDEGATDISVKPRLVYLDKDRTVNFNG